MAEYVLELDDPDEPMPEDYDGWLREYARYISDISRAQLPEFMHESIPTTDFEKTHAGLIRVRDNPRIRNLYKKRLNRREIVGFVANSLNQAVEDANAEMLRTSGKKGTAQKVEITHLSFEKLMKH